MSGNATGVRRVLSLVLLVVGLALAACSPEATRTRSGGPGADIGNRGPVIDMHGQQSPFYETPRYAPAASGR